jgi:hypothetical protein
MYNTTLFFEGYACNKREAPVEFPDRSLPEKTDEKIRNTFLPQGAAMKSIEMGK